MEIPEKITITGDKIAGEKLKGLARQQMDVLENMMSFQKLDQNTSERHPYPGATIKCSKVFGQRVIEIDAPEQRGGVFTVEWTECYCFPHFSMGIIKKVTPESPTTVELRTVRFKYDIDICTKRKYVLKKDIYSAGWERYYVGQYVLVSIGAALNKPPVADFDTDRNCLMQQPRFDTLIVSPIHIFGGMKKWGKKMSRTVPV
jgi:hypothetical protein